ncbi:preprotein translocase subunit YajC [Roseibium salinum]|uniref:Sec translocon accessory complex subunit YajC n=1 Tax=Roseibium salinum TaxID=1604349 RepID=A0ABT3R0P6_9HYPH|nr:preprotein translocase subunit YajC [Roseibium sp. DSM 29163]MCX2722788.1 preprotein translocase subunit YajC [Roseibium sp. DSM 29163]MDN3719275.1 preprotein translocase subunit YajC [Roseibium salinum]
MFITPAYAQTGGIAGPDFLMSLLPFVAIFAIMYFLIIRPQRQRMKQHQEMVANVRRGDTIVTTGGLIGKVSKVVDDGELQVELAEGVKVRLVRSMVQDVRSKSEPAKDNA